MSKITRDNKRFHEIIRGKIKKDLKKYISHGEMFGKQGGKKVSIPVPRIGIPRFTLDPMGRNGVSHGPGEPGDQIGKGQPGEKGDGGGEASDQDGENSIEVDVSIDELIQIMSEELELPRIEPKGSKQIETIVQNYNSISNEGPESLRHNQRTYKRALKRSIASGSYSPNNPVIIPRKEDKVYRHAKTKQKPQSQAVIFYVMDVSGSMEEEQKEIVRTAAFWIDGWLSKNYSNLDIRYITHSTKAKEVDRHEFYHTKESGGTVISSSLELVTALINKEYPVSDWNIYVFQFSDGDNWGHDEDLCVKILKDELLSYTNQFSYGQVKSPFGSGHFIKVLESEFEKEDKVVTFNMESKEDVLGCLKTFLGKGR